MEILNKIRNFFKPQKSKLFLEVLKEHLVKEETDNNLSIPTKEKHGYQYNNIEAFLKFNGMELISVHEIKHKHAEKLRTWLHANLKCSLNHSTRHVKLCKAACDYAVSQEYIDHNKLSGIKAKREKAKEPVSLNKYEVLKFKNYQAKRELWKRVLNLFMFQCYTGLSYMDLWLYEIEFEEVKELDVIIELVTCETGRGKTKKMYWTEFIPEAKEMHNFYDGKMPWVCVQSYNKILKKICKELGITKKVTTHTARKTFATLKRNKGHTIPAIALMIGDNDSTTIKHYITRNKELLIEEIINMRLKETEFNRLRIA